MAGITATTVLAAMASGFTATEREAIVAQWNRPEAYRVEPSDRWEVRLTVEGSEWLLDYDRLRGRGKGGGMRVWSAPEEAAIEAWVEAVAVAQKAYFGQLAAQANNESFSGHWVDPGSPPVALFEHTIWPPPLYGMVKPNRYTVTFPDGQTITYTDQVAVRHRYGYFRYGHGVMRPGVPARRLPAEELDALMRAAGISASEGRILLAVSLLEGGFESINTYDTGLVSVGVIQFACLREGGGSLAQLLKRNRQQNPAQHEERFRRYGVDATDDGRLMVVRPTDGTVAVGSEAAQAIIDDKRLTAVFERAGRECRAFRAAQLRTARDLYLPADDPIRVRGPHGLLVGRVRDVMRSEAGLATLTDRKVHTGSLGPFVQVLAEYAQTTGAKQLSDLAPYEADIIARTIHRRDYRSDATLTQPARVENREGQRNPSRGGQRKGRGE
jgi:hypothetical protein